MASAKVSVIIATYNCGPYLGAAIDSLLAQTLPPFEIIVVDDGSTDKTDEVLRAYEGRVISVRQANAGVSVARNKALELAQGNFVAVLDADDICASDRFERQTAALSQDPSSLACVTGFWRFRDNSNSRVEIPGDPKVATAGVLDFWTNLNLALSASVMFRRDRSEGLLYPPNITSGEDMLFLGTLRSRGGFVAIPEPLYGYRTRLGSAAHRYSEVESFRQRFQWASQHWKQYLPDVSLEELEERFWEAFAERLKLAYWGRRRESFFAIRDVMRTEWPARLLPSAAASWRWYPTWMWKAKDWIDRLRG